MKSKKQTIRKLFSCVLAAALTASGAAAVGGITSPTVLTVTAASSDPSIESQIQGLFDQSDYRMLTLASGVTKAQVTSLASTAASKSLSEEASYLIDRAVKIVNGQKIYDSDREKQPERSGDMAQIARQNYKQYRLGYNRQSTGIWAVPGKTIHVFVKADSSDPLPKLAFYQHCGQTSGNKEVQLKAGMNTISVPYVYGTDWSVSPEFGDIVYINNPYDETKQSANVRVYFDDGDKIPVFTKGGDSKAFRRQLAEYYKHFMAGEEGYHNITELVSDHVIADLMLGRCYNVLAEDGLDPNTTLEKWDTFFESMEEFDGLSKDEVKSLRTIVKICQPYGGAFASLGLIGIQDNGWQDAFLNGIYEWGITHELGHMMDYFSTSDQGSAFDRQFVENTNNVWSEYFTVLNGTPSKNCILKTMSIIAPDNIKRSWTDRDGSYYENMYCFYDLECYHHGYWGELDDMFRASSCGNSEADTIMKSLTDSHERIAAYSSKIVGIDLTYYFQKYQFISDTPSAAYTNALSKFSLSKKQPKFWYYDDKSYYDTVSSNADKNASLTIESIVNSGTVNYLTFSVPQNCTTSNLGFEIKRNGETVGFTYSGEYTDTGITSGTNYTYTVTAYDRALNAYASAQSTVTAASQKPAVRVNGTDYQTLEAAISAAPSGSTVTLLRSLVMTSGVTLENKNITIIPADSSKRYYIVDNTPNNADTFLVKGGSLTFKTQSGSSADTLVFCDTNKGAGRSIFSIHSGGTLTLDNAVCVKNCKSNKNGSLIYSANSQVNIKGASFRSNTAKYGHMISVDGSSVLDISGYPTFEYNVCSNGASLIYLSSQSGIVNMKEVTMYHNDCGTESGVATVFANAGTVNIGNDTVFEGNMSGDLWYSAGLYLKEGSKANLSNAVYLFDSSTVEAENLINLNSNMTGEVYVKVARGMDKEGFSVAQGASSSVLSRVKYTEDKYTVTALSTKAVLKDNWNGYSTVVTKYVDSSTGKEIALPEVRYYKSGDKYSVFAKDIKGYKFTGDIPEGTSGTVSSAQKIITYRYTPVNEKENSIRVHYFNKNGWNYVTMYSYDESVSPTAEYQGKWPGTNMYNDPVFKLYYEETNPKKDWYYAEINANKATVIFNNHNDKDAATKVQEPDGVGTPGYSVTPGDNWIQNGKVYKTGIVNVRYESTTGELLDAALLKGISNGTDTYKAAAKDIKGYTLKTTPSNASGKFTDAAVTVTYVYEKDEIIPPTEPLTNSSTISAESVTSGTSVKLTAKASGGTSPYLYTYRYRASGASTWTNIGNPDVSDATKTFLINNTGIYEIQVLVKDSSGDTASKNFTLTVKAPEADLTNSSTVSATSVSVGTSVKLTAKATGGTAPYTYALMYKKSSSSTWTKIGTKYGTASTGSFKPGKAVPYDVMINVKDATGKIKSKTFKINVTGLLTNTSTVSATSVSVGTSVKLTAKATGGTAPYTYALMYKKSSSSTWTKIGTKYGTASTGSFKPGKAVPYDIMINVKDSTGKVSSKTFKLTVK